ncbi:putative flavonoid 3'-monooxygenase [Helianthus annuus]|uniref:Flavonoid 3'-monooxygenase n=1 Tax=Helianthus annuus TaxID=4232 RepID=A0A251TZ19_HELAN|nr:cytochrome P450 78A5 [Helianthus annuus]KAF5792629.1 putative flavonoid 3'-monooxygenase [Helianthus annuus]KAJ0536297.1 putative flavonoid 3'-monooxygenase [Helianthus annuus]KAJ0543963.1 putative flavonoid 3'-monooxygenase [Helianthus annuus]
MSSSPVCFPTTTETSSVLTFNLFLCVVVFVSIFAFLLAPGGLAWALSKPRPKTAIPGPSGIPLLGLLFAFTSSLTHRTLAKLSTAFNAKPLMAFSVGLTRFVISSSPDTAKEILNSSDFADRPIKESAYELLFHRAMGFAPYGDYWRSLRRISATHLFSPKRVAGFGVFRETIGLKMVGQVLSTMEQNGVVEVKKILHFGSLNNVMMSVFGRLYDFGENGGEGCELEELVSEGYELLGIFNWSDHFPVVSWFDLQGVRKRCRKLVSKVNVFVKEIIMQHREKRASGAPSSGDFVDVLLDLESENKFSDGDMIAVLWEMIFRGTDTVAILLEWILARMVLHPDIQAKAQSEIDRVTGGRPVTDSDLDNLPYLQAIVKETLRMHPPGPLLSWARLATQDTVVGPHMVPAGTTAMVNMWAITHDERVWSEPSRFNPDRFLTEEVAIMGSDLRLAPFGAGRRVCPGKALGITTVHLWLAQMLQKFKWVEAGSVDLSECLKLSLEMKKPLVCRAVGRA